MQRTDEVVESRFFLVLWCAAVLGVASSVSAGQLERASVSATLHQLVTGRVVMPDGSPAVGAVVVTSVGGQGLCDVEGSFALEVELPLDLEILDVTAVADQPGGSGSLVATIGIVPASLTSASSAGRIALTLSPDCHPRWLPTFGARPGTDDDVHALVAFDDGSGPALYLGGDFAMGILRWKDSRWSALGSGVSGGVRALTVYDDGNGPALYAGGYFTSAGGVAASFVAKWDGSSWSPLGTGIVGSYVRALAVYDDGSGPALYAGGAFTSAGGTPANSIARWDGTSWSELGSGTGLSSAVLALTVWDDGSGPALFAGGFFHTAGGVPAEHVAKWNGSSWSALSTGTNTWVQALAVYDDGSGPALHAGGQFTDAGGAPANHIAKWDGSSWSALAGGMNGYVNALAVFDDGSGAVLVSGSNNGPHYIARWDGSSWSPMHGGMDASVLALAPFDDGSGPALYAGGAFLDAGGAAAERIARWDGSNWSALTNGVNGDVRVLLASSAGGPALYAGGSFTTAGGIETNRIATWNGSSWSSLDSGVNGQVRALAEYDDGGGTALYAAGSFSSSVGGQLSVSNIAKWNGSSWLQLGSGTFGGVNALAVFDDGSGPALFAGGCFRTAGGLTVNGIAKWDGASWSALGSGIDSVTCVVALAVYDDGGGPALYAGGSFSTMDGVPAHRIAKWDGSSWSALGSGLGNVWATGVRALVVHDDGSGPALYAGGAFVTAGGAEARRVARWNGSSWSALGHGMPSVVDALVVHDDGSGPALYAGGEFGNRIAKWDGSSWSYLGFGIDQDVRALASWDGGDGPALHAGGEFLFSPAGDSFLAKWGCRMKPTVKKRKL